MEESVTFQRIYLGIVLYTFMLLIFLVEVNPTLLEELADVFHQSFLACVMRCRIMHEYLMRTLSNLETDVRNELLDLKNIHLPQIS